MLSIKTSLVWPFALLALGGSLIADQAPPPAHGALSLAPAPTLPAPAAPQTNTTINATNALGAKIKFENAIFDFGRIKSGDVVKHVYNFTNIGDATLELTGVQPTCGCTAAAEWSRKVEPGAAGAIPMQFNSASFNGAVLKTITVTCNDKTQPAVVLQLKGTIWKPVDVLPQFAMINVPADLATASTEVKIINNMEEPLTVSPPEINNAAFQAVVTTNQPGKEYLVKITVTVATNAGNAQGLVSLKTSSTNMPVVHITAWANVIPSVMVMPPMVNLPAAPLAGKATPVITIQNNSTNTLTLSDPAINVPGVDINLTAIQTGRVYNVSLTFPEGFSVPAGQQAVFTIKSSALRQPVISVPIIQPPKPIAFVPPAAPAPNPTPGAVPAPIPAPILSPVVTPAPATAPSLIPVPNPVPRPVRPPVPAPPPLPTSVGHP